MAKKKVKKAAGISQADRRLIAYALECLAGDMKRCSRDDANTKSERKSYSEMQADCVRLAALFSKKGAVA
jgi:hypothetical protein